MTLIFGVLGFRGKWKELSVLLLLETLILSQNLSRAGVGWSHTLHLQQTELVAHVR